MNTFFLIQLPLIHNEGVKLTISQIPIEHEYRSAGQVAHEVPTTSVKALERKNEKKEKYTASRLLHLHVLASVPPSLEIC